MGFLIDDHEFLADVDSLKRLNGNTKDGMIYRYNDEALKLLKSNNMTYNKACFLRNNITSPLFLKPLRIVKDLSGKFVGYTSAYKQEIKNGIFEMSTKEFIDNFSELRDAFVDLANGGINTLDVGYHNTIVADDNGRLRLYICDLDRYLYAEGKTYAERLHGPRIFLKDENLLKWKKLYEEALKTIILSEENSSIDDFYLGFELRRYLNLLFETDNSFPIIKKELSQYENMNEYFENVKKKVLGR